MWFISGYRKESITFLLLRKMNSLFEAITRVEGLAQARGTQIMNLLRLPDEMREFLLELDDPKEIRKYSERRLRSMKKSSLTGMM